ncbi:MAG: cation-transporting P-type ATPase, partial [Gemmataceae bacterium]
MKPTNHHQILPKKLFAAIRQQKPQIAVSRAVVESAVLDVAAVYARLATRPAGLTTGEAAARLADHGPNVLAKDRRAGLGKLIWNAVVNPLVILLLVLAGVSFATGDARAGVVMSMMIVLGAGLKLVQEARADSAAAKLKAMISVTATVVRDGTPREIPVAQLVPGDVVQLAAGDMIPGDLSLIEAKDLFVTQGSLTGESFPVEKFAVENHTTTTVPLELTSIAFLGTSVESGSATAVVVATGAETYLGGMAESLSEQSTQTAFDQGIARFTVTRLPPVTCAYDLNDDFRLDCNDWPTDEMLV